MAIERIIQNYLEQPLPLWENEITQLLVEHKWAELSTESNITPSSYTIAGCVIKNMKTSQSNFLSPVTSNEINIEMPSNDLKGFYEEHGIAPVEIATVESSEDVSKILCAIDILKSIAPVHDFILKIVHSMQLIKAEYPDTDVSYSHPEIPFSVFFSLCDEVSIISDLRVAESILHEAMHLKLTLIENHVDLIKANSQETFYSPWRNENRPLRGVLHGIFVFKAIKDFYDLLAKQYFGDLIKIDFLKFRIKEIEKEFESLKRFPNNQGLTVSGKLLASKLLQF